MAAVRQLANRINSRSVYSRTAHMGRATALVALRLGATVALTAPQHLIARAHAASAVPHGMARSLYPDHVEHHGTSHRPARRHGGGAKQVGVGRRGMGQM